MSLGFNMMLGPELDTWDTVEDPGELSPAHQPVSELPFNPGMQLTGIGSHPQLVERLGSALLAAYQSSGILAVAGPFPGRAPGHYEHPGGSAAPKVNGVACADLCVSHRPIPVYTHTSYSHHNSA